MEKIKFKLKHTDLDTYINIFLSQDINNIGTFTDVPFLFNEKITPVKGNNFTRIPHTNIDRFLSGYKTPSIISANGSSELELFKRYGSTISYDKSLIKKKDTIISQYTNSYDVVNVVNKFFKKDVINKLISNPIIETENTNNDYVESLNLVNDNLNENNLDYIYYYGINVLNSDYVVQKHGIYYKDYVSYNGDKNTIIEYLPQGYNYTNTSYSAIINEEHLLGVIDVKETKSDIDIYRKHGINVFEQILKLGEINNSDHLSRYGNGEFNIIK